VSLAGFIKISLRVCCGLPLLRVDAREPLSDAKPRNWLHEFDKGFDDRIVRVPNGRRVQKQAILPIDGKIEETLGPYIVPAVDQWTAAFITSGLQQNEKPN
jgi:hypothetical protein